MLLASNSSSRKNLLNQAGIEFRAVSPPFDEDFYKAEYRKTMAESLVAEKLAQGKALSVSETCDDLVLGADQSKSLENKPIDKPASRRDALEQCLMLAGKTHCIHSSACLVQDGKIVWTFSQDNFLTMHPMSRTEIQDYLDLITDDILLSSGVYQIEGLGLGLFSKIDGDFFSIVGLPLIPLMNKLRQLR